MESVIRATRIWRVLYWNLESYLYSQLARAYRLILFGTSTQSLPATIHDIKILLDSPHFLVVNKAPDVLINSSDESAKVTVEKQLEHLYPDLVNPTLAFSFYFTHRLDYSTSGILCIAKHRNACAVVSKEFSKRRVLKYYLAIVRGHLSQNYIKIDEPIGKDTREKYEKTRMALKSMPYCSHETRSALTHVMLLETGLYNNYPASKILLRPITGRRHQLRVHLHGIGHSIVGDYTYSNRRDVLPHRMFLHAYRLVINNSLQPLNITTEDPFGENDPKNCWKPYNQIKSIAEGLHELSLS